MRDALATIGEARGSYRIRKFLETGQDREFRVFLSELAAG